MDSDIDNSHNYTQMGGLPWAATLLLIGADDHSKTYEKSQLTRRIHSQHQDLSISLFSDETDDQLT